tara:strand:+ start:873 stop:1427 length:555 start_codon:yes stop_codon:yes gene_type:complete
VPPTDGRKECTECGKVYPIADYHRTGPRRQGRRLSKCRHCVCKEKKEYRDKYPDRIKKARDKHYRKNSAYIKAKRAFYRKHNKAKCNASQARRRSKEKPSEDACPKKITKIYQFCSELNSRTDTEWEVDHVAPLAWGGFHHEDNLQVVPKEWNQHKAASKAEFWGGEYPEWARDYLIDAGLDII